MAKKFSELEKELLHKTKAEENLKKQKNYWKERALKDRKMLKSMSGQYERVAREYKKNFDKLFNNAPKLFAVYLIQKLNQKIEKVVR